MAIRTPLVRFNADGPEIYLKLENLQPIGSFKIRGAANAIAKTEKERLSRGLLTASAGNMAQGVAFCARRLGIPATVIAPDTAPETKLRAVEDWAAGLSRLRSINGGGHSNNAPSRAWRRRSSMLSTIPT